MQEKNKSIGVLRWGGFGDMLMSSIVFPYLKNDGYHITLYGTDRNLPVVKFDPHVDKRVSIEAGSIPREKWDEYWEECRSHHDRFINFSGSIEGQLLKPEGHAEFEWSHELRHQVCDINYYDWTMMWAGYPKVKGQNVQMYFSPAEVSQTKKRIKKHNRMFKIVWALSGSSPHKAWPYVEIILKQFLLSHRDVAVYFVGDLVCSILSSRHWIGDGDKQVMRRIKEYSGKMTIRSTLCLAHHADLVIGPETGVMNAVGGQDMGKILFLSHSSHENLSKYWKNTAVMVPSVDCHPCHQLHYTASSCPRDKALGAPVCQIGVGPKEVAEAINRFYEEWKR